MKKSSDGWDGHYDSFIEQPLQLGLLQSQRGETVVCNSDAELLALVDQIEQRAIARYEARCERY